MEHVVGDRASGASRPARVQAILSATLELLGELGYDQLTIDAVAARAGSSKATIYRRWKDKGELVAAALVAQSRRHPELPAGAASLREDLLGLIALMSRVAEREGSRLFVGLLAAAEQDRNVAEAVRVTAVEPRRQDCRDVIQRAIGRGELRDPRLATTLFDLAVGQMMVRSLLRLDAFDADEQARFVDQTVIPALTAHDGAAGEEVHGHGAG